MKCVFIYVLLAITVYKVKSKEIPKADTFSEVCINELKFGDATRVKIGLKQYEDLEVQQYLECLFNKFGVFDNNGNLIQSKVEEVLFNNFNTPPFMLKCFIKKNTKAETASQFMKCFNEMVDTVASKFQPSVTQCMGKQNNQQIKFPDVASPESKNLLLCVYRQTGIIDDKGKLDSGKISEYLNCGDPLPNSTTKCIVEKETPLDTVVEFLKCIKYKA